MPGQWFISGQEAGVAATHGRMVAAVLGVGKAVPLAAGPAMARIVTYAHRYKRPPRRKKAVALEGPKVVRRRVFEVASPANPPVTPASEARKSAIVTSRRRSRVGEAPDLTPKELQRRRDAADAIMQDFKREIAARLRQGSAPLSKKP
jgi:hypothetical protein